MPLEPLKQWICDHCHDLIEKADDGWLEWYQDEATKKLAGFRIVHHSEKCQYDDSRPEWRHRSLSDNHLQYFTGYDGLAQLLVLFDYEKFEDPYQLTDVIRRIHLPYYEEARQYWERAKEDGLLYGERYTDRDYFQDKLIAIIERYTE
jgi:hypothetical protein